MNEVKNTCFREGYVRYFLFFFFILSGSFSYSQTHLAKQWDHRFGGPGEDELSTFKQTNDRGFILGGNSWSCSGGEKTSNNSGSNLFSDFWIVKTDKLGNKQWDKSYGGSMEDVLRDVQQTGDGGYILGGYSNSDIGGDKTESNRDTSSRPLRSSDYWIVKTDSLGNKLWDKRFGGLYDDVLYCVQQTSDGGFMLGGFSQSGAEGDKTEPTRGSTDYWIVKTDANGVKQWDKRFGGSNNEQLYSMQQTKDGGYILGGYSWSQVSGDKSSANCGAVNYCDFWVVKIDSLGNKQWDNRYGGSSNDELFSIRQTFEGGYILGGFSWSGISGDKSQPNFGVSSTSDFWMLKIDSAGNKQWDQTFGGALREDEFGNLSQTRDGGFLIGGTSYSTAGGNKSENNQGFEQTWMIKTDGAGNKEWDKTIFTTGHDEAGFVMETKDGDYAVANFSNAGTGGYKTEANHDSTSLTYDYWLAVFSDTASLPHTDFTVSANSICAETCIDFTNLSYHATSFKWFFPGANPASDTTSDPRGICYNNPGNFDVTLIATNKNGSDTLVRHQYISVIDKYALITFVQSGDSLLAPKNYTAFQWYRNSLPIPGATGPVYLPAISGTYSVIATIGSGCQAMSEGVFVTVGLDELSKSHLNLKIFPVPASDHILFETSCEGNEAITLAIVNVLGEILMEEKVTCKRVLEMDLKNLDSGVYFLRATNSKNSWIGKFVKK